ncbi:hypothetical protein A2164_03635 [Candidatus Curtissbacteria bacterium RBG_13_35_7]|uniref:STAS/SEC14 domain-containing protein n=1 Tax=Candidatus Curtissbacteria bacterium RBG_13_35_7 TaxID=1797705 RepID=A0A1F5G3M9_9BACT|nr:MAG: hypothetical protein A2164_03635 [Candidatus Curtissbacteria bacterium RBG_13_35_7]
MDPKFKVWWDKQKKIVVAKFSGDQDEETAQKFRDEVNQLAENHGGQVKILTDATNGGSSTAEARKIYKDLFKSGKIEKSAIFGGGILQKVIANFIFSFGGTTKAEYFYSEEEALKWLKEK